MLHKFISNLDHEIIGQVHAPRFSRFHFANDEAMQRFRDDNAPLLRGELRETRDVEFRPILEIAISNDSGGVESRHAGSTQPLPASVGVDQAGRVRRATCESQGSRSSARPAVTI